MSVRDPNHGIAPLTTLRAVLGDSGALAPGDRLQALVDAGCADLPAPGAGDTAGRWRALAEVAAHDLSLVKRYEGHTDALAILRELGAPEGIAGSTAASTWGTWAAEAPGARVTVHPGPDGTMRLRGAKAWCSGARDVSHGLLTAWSPDGEGPLLVAVHLRQPGVEFSGDHWHAVGMATSDSVDVLFQDVPAVPVGAAGDYLRRPGFWQGGAGVAACWHGGAMALAHVLHTAIFQAPAAQRTPFRLAALGRVDRALADGPTRPRCSSACWPAWSTSGSPPPSGRTCTAPSNTATRTAPPSSQRTAKRVPSAVMRPWATSTTSGRGGRAVSWPEVMNSSPRCSTMRRRAAV